MFLRGVNTILEWNAGNHFVDSEKRMAKGFSWLMDCDNVNDNDNVNENVEL